VDELDDVLAAAQRQGFLGPASVAEHRRHALGFAAGWEDLPPLALDLGSGGGVPGLVLAVEYPTLSVCLVDSRERSTDWLTEAVRSLGLSNRVAVVRARGEELGRDLQWRAQVPMVVARGFGPPAVVAECGAPLLVTGASMVVSEPPTPDASRWPRAGLGELGLGLGRRWAHGGSHYQELVQLAPCPERFPRRVGVPAKRPLWEWVRARP